jgi:tRNA threonylcarbamoyl adenosine modification protein (Sua5/YciO/YrdC/YwlC family)
LRQGRLVAFPTETVYGLGADAWNPAAVRKLYSVKGRPAGHPVIVHFASADKAFEWAREVPDAAKILAKRFWPGPLTLVLKRAPKAPDFVTGGQDNVGLRVPSHPVAHELLEAFGGGVAAPSANRFGAVSPTTAAHVLADLGTDVDLVLEGGSTEVGIESTIVDLSGAAPVLLRPGHVSREALAAALGVAVEDKRASSPRHSGGLERHYAPRNARAPRRHARARCGNRAPAGRRRRARLHAARRARRLLAAHAARPGRLCAEALCRVARARQRRLQADPDRSSPGQRPVGRRARPPSPRLRLKKGSEQFSCNTCGRW